MILVVGCDKGKIKKAQLMIAPVLQKCRGFYEVNAPYSILNYKKALYRTKYVYIFTTKKPLKTWV